MSKISSLKDITIKPIMEYLTGDGKKPGGEYDIITKNNIDDKLIKYLDELNKKMETEYIKLKNENLEIHKNMEKKKEICEEYFKKINTIIKKYLDLFKKITNKELISQFIIISMITCDDHYAIGDLIKLLINNNNALENKKSFICDSLIPRVLKKYLSSISLYSSYSLSSLQEQKRYENINKLLEKNECKVNKNITDFFKDIKINDNTTGNEILKNKYLVNYLINLNNDNINKWLYNQLKVRLEDYIKSINYVDKEEYLKEYKKINNINEEKMYELNMLIIEKDSIDRLREKGGNKEELKVKMKEIDNKIDKITNKMDYEKVLLIDSINSDILFQDYLFKRINEFIDLIKKIQLNGIEIN